MCSCCNRIVSICLRYQTLLVTIRNKPDFLIIVYFKVSLFIIKTCAQKENYSYLQLDRWMSGKAVGKVQ